MTKLIKAKHIVALQQAPKHRSTLAGICQFIRCCFAYYAERYTSCQNSIRHNLRLNDCFLRVARDATPSPGTGNRSYWTPNPAAESTYHNGSFLRYRKRFRPTGNAPTTWYINLENKSRRETTKKINSITDSRKLLGDK